MVVSAARATAERLVGPRELSALSPWFQAFTDGGCAGFSVVAVLAFCVLGVCSVHGGRLVGPRELSILSPWFQALSDGELTAWTWTCCAGLPLALALPPRHTRALVSQFVSFTRARVCCTAMPLHYHYLPESFATYTNTSML